MFDVVEIAILKLLKFFSDRHPFFVVAARLCSRKYCISKQWGTCRRTRCSMACFRGHCKNSSKYLCVSQLLKKCVDGFAIIVFYKYNVVLNVFFQVSSCYLNGNQKKPLKIIKCPSVYDDVCNSEFFVRIFLQFRGVFSSNKI